jgi:SAM-dependent methyltransferase
MMARDMHHVDSFAHDDDSQVVIGPPHDVAPFQYRFANLIAHDKAVKGRVLDIGCGPGFHRSLSFIPRVASQVDGVDPGRGIEDNTSVTMKWRGGLEEAPIPPSTYDLAVAYNVVEHIADPHAFLRAVHRLLKPGGHFWALTPHSRHLFAMLSRGLECAGLKSFIADRNASVNDYPAYYRLNSRRQVERCLTALPLQATHIECMTAPGWYKVYFPRCLHWSAKIYDNLLGDRFESFHLIFMFCLERTDGA